ncbi:MAG: hypothetical protein R3280_13995 [Marinobacter sp.]|uniref:hypothetical protein n=1 Tax=Marinobacter sp. TaxID=50741 RepID=UPI00299E9B44|nr:hypothetical protein [Marinobacter sp.]MDX1635749.1 hypothetical protein [Marinobacter sp.]
MTVQQQNIVTPLPSSILHNGRQARAEHTRVAARHASAAVRRQLNALARQLRGKRDWPNPPMPEA